VKIFCFDRSHVPLTVESILGLFLYQLFYVRDVSAPLRQPDLSTTESANNLASPLLQRGEKI
jgi:hypothetical protein